MIIELWTWRKSGKNAFTYGLWRTFESSHDNIPPVDSILIYTDKKNKSRQFIVKQIEYEYQFNHRSFRIQLCVKDRFEKK